MTRVSDSNNPYLRRRKHRRSSRRIYRRNPLMMAVILTAIGIAVCRQAFSCDSHQSARVDFDVPKLMEVAAGTSGTMQQLVEYTGFTVSFNPGTHQPNYVVWELLADELDGDARRDNKFAADDDVKGSASPADYRNSGYDRGHMAPAADFKWSTRAMKETHFLTNISPQHHTLNAGAWATLETNCRSWARRDSAIIIVCGPVLSDYMPDSIGQPGARIPVPARFFKVVLAPFADPPAGIGFIMNNGIVEGGVQAAAVTIDQVEAITGYDFFAALPDEIEREVESQCAYHYWQRKK